MVSIYIDDLLAIYFSIPDWLNIFNRNRSYVKLYFRNTNPNYVSFAAIK